MADMIGSPERAATFLDAVRARRASFEAAARRAEEERTLPADIVALLHELRLFWLKSPREVGGSELDPLEFCDVLEELAYYDASAAWAVMIGNGVTGTVAGWMPDEGLREIFTGIGPGSDSGVDPGSDSGADQGTGTGSGLPVCAGQFVARGTAVPVDGGYRVTGRWSFCSGINHSGWVVGGCTVEGRPDVQILAVVPKSEATLHDTWHVAGLQGTGSGDFSLAGVFVPAGRTIDWLRASSERGGVLFNQIPVLYLSNELGPVVIGIARRAVDDMYALAASTTRRVGGGGVALSERAAFQKEMGRAEARLHAARLLYRDAVRRSWEVAQGLAELGELFVPRQLAEHTLVVEECMDLVGQIIRYGGGRVLGLDHPMQRHLRNLAAARQHVYVSDENYEVAGKARLAEHG